MTRDFSPERLDVDAFAAAGATLSGDEVLGQFARLAQDAEGPLDGARIAWQARGESRPGLAGPSVAWLRLTADGSLPVVCQRCLMPMEQRLHVDRWFRFVADESVAAAEDEASDEDVLVASSRFDLLGLIEDELLMEVPAAPRHEQCPIDPRLSSEDERFKSADADKPKPFAVLEVLRSGKTG